MTIKDSSVYIKIPAYTLSDGVKTDVTSNVLCTRVRDGNELANHEILIGKGLNATTALSATYSDVKLRLVGKARCVRIASKLPWESTHMGINPVIPSLTSVTQSMRDKAKAQCLSHAYAKIREMQNPFQGQAFLGELRETIDFLKNPLKKMMDLSESLWSLKRKGGIKKFVNASASQWLEFRFAILPLIYDTKAIIDIIRDQVERDDRLSYRFYGKSDLSTNTTPSYSVNGVMTVKAIETTVSRAEYVVRFGLLLEHLEKHEDVCNRLLATCTHIEDVLLTAWELTTLSWLVDYFVNVEDIISAITTGTNAVSWTSSSEILSVEKEYVTFSASINAGNLPYYNTPSHDPRVVVTSRRDVTRSSAALAIPPMTFSLPGSNIRYMNIAALLAKLAT
jgi:hypothetical protein